MQIFTQPSLIDEYSFLCLTVQRRIAAIQAIRDAEIENLLSRLRLLRSCLSKEQQKSPALQFFRENYPNLSVVKNESDGIFELEWKDKVGNLSLNHVTGRNVPSSLDTASTLPASGLGLEFSIESCESSLYVWILFSFISILYRILRSFFSLLFAVKMNFVEAASLQIPGSVCL